MRFYQDIPEPEENPPIGKNSFLKKMKKTAYVLSFLAFLVGVITIFLIFNIMSSKEKGMDLYKTIEQGKVENHYLMVKMVHYKKSAKEDPDDVSHIYHEVYGSSQEKFQRGDLVKFNHSLITQQTMVDGETFDMVDYRNIFYRIPKQNVNETLLKRIGF